ncbi:MAG: NTP transferase domain-containing protein [Lachnospiraceae bacterium]|nr:NTP transferase domain-containing protein [Lachnospiraceae bacterium]
MEKTLIILAAGIGSRFGGGVKQLTPVDDHGHLIIDYSIHDAIAAGFNKIIFIIRSSIEVAFRERIGDRIEKICAPLGVTVAYAYQEMEKYVETVPVGRTKPWGTGHAVLCCQNLIETPFSVINADDYYGKEGFVKAAEFLSTNPDGYGLIGYQLRNTLSDNGGVTRGICSASEGKLTGIAETRNIVKTASSAEADGRALDVDALVSMNFWCYPAGFLSVLRRGFPEFLEKMSDPLKDEYLLPTIADGLIRKGMQFTVLPTDDHWFGVTYREDKPAVTESFRKLIAAGVYQEDLYSDL